ncbi:hypothetical protein [Azospirillum thermophilum]|uniref:Uncharacterized protein n=1 Tax=Azospirillum thermophilum TaxID=2202148 RepID=A0A2S2CLA3_9PROT|nr:hypothetical protein [Azospirillum thermophilum]AWK85261.1 hypothetical protein DEW08_02870 [Azospirillum thermophilum]
MSDHVLMSSDALSLLDAGAHAGGGIHGGIAELAAQAPVGALILLFLVLHAILTLLRRAADRLDPPPAPRRPVRMEVPPSPRVWRFGARSGKAHPWMHGVRR